MIENHWKRKDKYINMLYKNHTKSYKISLKNSKIILNIALADIALSTEEVGLSSSASGDEGLFVRSAHPYMTFYDVYVIF